MRNGSYITGLRIWNSGSDYYDHDELAANWDAVDGHDHSPENGGRRIPRGGLEPGAVDGVVLAPDSVTSTHIVNKTIQRIDLADGIIGTDQIDPAVFSWITPLGVITPWFRPVGTIPVPAGWTFADGRTLAAGQHAWSGITNVTVPDLRGKFVLGSADPNPPTGVTAKSIGTGVNDAPAEASTGGAHARYFNHSHTVPGHSHTVNDHTHTVNNHTHPITLGGNHNHSIHSRTNAFIQSLTFEDMGGNTRRNDLQSLYIAGFNGANSDPLDALAPSTGEHNHGGQTQGASPGTGGATPGTSSEALTTDPQNPGGDIRPAYVGLLYIIKVKHGA